MSQTIEVEVGNLAALAHEQLSGIEDYDETVSENVESMILALYRQAEKQSEDAATSE